MSKDYDLKKIDNFGLRLELYIKINFDSAAEFSRFIEIDPSRINSYLKGRSAPTTKQLYKFHYTGANIVWLLTGEGAMYASNDIGRELYKKNKEKYLQVQHEDDEEIANYIREHSIYFNPDDDSYDENNNSDDKTNPDEDDNSEDLNDFFNELGEKIKELPEMINKLKNK
jgi:hypothetical protein